MKVLVVGGAGYIGSQTVYELLRANHEVVVLDNLSTGERSFIPKTVQFIHGDIRVKQDLVKVFASHKFDCVMHFAAKLIVPESMVEPLEYYHNNVEGVRLLLETMNEYQVKNFVFSSTAAVYGEIEGGVCREDSPTNPINPYGESKLACEKLIKWAGLAHGINYVIFRYFNVAGADESLEIGLKKDQITHLIPAAIQAALKIRSELTIFGLDYPTKDGSCIRDYIHVADLAQAHILGANYLYQGGQSEIFNLGSAMGYSVLEVKTVVEKIIPLKAVIGLRRAGDPPLLIADTTKVKEILGFEPKLNLEVMITSDLAYRKKFI